MSRTRSSRIEVDFGKIKLYDRDEEIRVLQSILLEVCGQMASDGDTKSSDDTQVDPSVKDGIACNAKVLSNDAEKVTGKGVEIGRQNNEIQYIASSKVLKRKVVLLTGVSGSGKSSLITKALKHEVIRAQGFFAVGKEAAGSSLPFSAFSLAFSGLCLDMLQSPQRDEIRESLSDFHFQALSILVPAVLELMAEVGDEVGDNGSLAAESIGDCDTSSAFRSELTTADSQHQSIVPESQDFVYKCLVNTIKEFLRRVCTAQRPIVLFLDDLHRMDQPSLDIFNAIAMESSIQGLLLVGAYRIDEAPQNLTELECKLDHSINVTRLCIGEIGIDHIRTIISDLSNEPSGERFHELAVVIHKKTRGNPLFVIQYLRTLMDDLHVQIDLVTLRWDWKIKDIVLDTSITDNLIGFIAAKITTQPVLMQRILHIASCFGYRFNASKVSLACNALDVDASGEEFNPEIVIKLLNRAVEEGLVVRFSNSKEFAFAHDKVQEAAYNLQAGDDRARAHLTIGRIVNRLRKDQPSLLLAATDQLNKALHLVTGPDERIDLARMNLHAALVACRQAAFFPAVKYLTFGVELLGPEAIRWAESHDLALQICTKLCELHYFVGSFVQCYVIVEEVKRHSVIPEALFRLDCIKMNALGCQGQPRKAIDTGRMVLSRHGERIPSRVTKATAIVDLVRTLKVLRNKTDEQLFALPLLEDKRIKAVIEVLNHMIAFAYQLSDEDLLAVISCRMARYTVLYGFYLPQVFGHFGVVLCALNKYTEGYRYGKLCCRLLEERSFPNQYACAAQLPPFFLMHLQEPLPYSIDTMTRGHDIGMTIAADPKHACACAAGVVHSFFLCGFPLNTLLDDCQKYRNEAFGFGQMAYYYMIACMNQVALKFTTTGCDPALLIGDVLSENEHLYLREADHFLRLCLWSGKLTTAVYFNDEAISLEISEIYWKIPLVNEGAHPYKFFRIFFMGITAFRFARSTGKRKHIRRGRRTMRFLKVVVDQGGRSYRPLLMILEAEQAWQQKRESAEVKDAFEKAISIANRSGYQNLVALANESVGRYFSAQGDLDWASHYFTSAGKAYTEWEATAKVEDLERSELFVSQNISSMSSFHTGKAQYNPELARKHKRVQFDQSSSDDAYTNRIIE